MKVEGYLKTRLKGFKNAIYYFGDCDVNIFQEFVAEEQKLTISEVKKTLNAILALEHETEMLFMGIITGSSYQVNR